MINAEKIEQKLGFKKIREQIAGRCSTNYAKQRAGEEEVSCKKETIDKRLRLTDEMRVISIFEQSFPRNGYVDTIHFLKPLETPSAVISLNDMISLKQFLATLKELTLFFREDKLNSGKSQKYPNLFKLAAPVIYPPEILYRIDEIVDRHGEVKDTASPQLQEIRRNLREKEYSVSRRVQAVLKRAKDEGIVDLEAKVSVREGKILIPVDAGAKRRLPGYVYDESATGKTVYIEPAEVVELNNEVRELYFAQQREIARILAEFSDFVRPFIPELLMGSRFVGEIDFLLAKAKVALDMEAGMPIISQDNELKLVRARHPLLEAALKREGKPIVPLNLTLTPTKHILIISGPNAGGKSVCLKTTGLLQYMFQWGLLIPAAETSELRIFKEMFIDIGDEQSLENDLSTYSSHLTNMKEMLQWADKESLVLIDEFGSGTEPTAGGAIAEAILREIDSKGVYGVITTHYTNLKYYAQNIVGGARNMVKDGDKDPASGKEKSGGKNGAINGAMLFDVGKIMPLFNLEIGLPGNSFAFELARKIGLPDKIIKEAQEVAGNGFVDLERQLRKISKNKRALDEKLQRIKITDKTLEGVTERYQKELVEIQKNKKSIIEEAKREAQELIAEANKRIEQTIKEIKEAQAQREQTIIARKSLGEFKESLNEINASETDKKIEAQMNRLIERKKRKEERKARGEKSRAESAGSIDNSSAATNTAANTTNSATSNAISPNVMEEKKAGLDIGDKVRIKDNGMVGEILTIGKNWVNVAVGSIISKVSISGVEPISNNEFTGKLKAAGKVTFKSSNIISDSINERKLNFKPQIDIRGQRLDEAIDSATRFIDDALMVGSSEVKILHGKGNGILKEEVRKFLLTMPGVVSCKDEDIRYGGSGITVVTLE